jgi:plasmid stability protein
VLADRGEGAAAFDGRCIPALGVARRLNIPDIRPPRALIAGRLARLGASRPSPRAASEATPVPTITVRNVSAKVVQSLKALARRHNRSMEQEVRELLEGYVAERRAVLDQIEASWSRQARRPTVAEVDAWLAIGRP